MKNKEILFLLTQDLESPSGLGRYRPMTKELVKQGFRVIIIALHPDFEHLENKSTILDGVEVHYVSQMHVIKRENRTVHFPWWKLPYIIFSATRKIYQKALEFHPDYVLVGKPHPMNGLPGIWLTKRRNVKLIVDCDDYEKESNHYSHFFQKVLVGFFELFIPKKAWKVTTNTFFMKSKLIEAGLAEKKIIYIPNGVDPDRFSHVNTSKIDKLRRDLGLVNKKVVLYIGSINLANHPVDLLLKAFVEVRKKDPNSKLLIVGGGNDLDKLSELSCRLEISDSTVFVGRVPSELAPLYYGLADVSVDPANNLPASAGRCPLKLFESWAMGVPFLTMDVGDRKILSANNSSAVLVDSTNLKDFSQKLISLLEDIGLQTKLRKNGFECIKQYYWSEITKILSELFK